MPTDNEWLRRIHDIFSAGAGPGGITQAQVESAVESAMLAGVLPALQSIDAKTITDLQGQLTLLLNQLVSIQNEINSNTVNGQVQGNDAAGQPLTTNPVPIGGVDSLGRVRRLRTTPEGYLQIMPVRPKFTNVYQFTGTFSQSVGALSGAIVHFVSGAPGATLDISIPAPGGNPSVRLGVGERWELRHTTPAGNLSGFSTTTGLLIYVTTFELWE